MMSLRSCVLALALVAAATGAPDAGAPEVVTAAATGAPPVVTAAGAPEVVTAAPELVAHLEPHAGDDRAGPDYMSPEIVDHLPPPSPDDEPEEEEMDVSGRQESIVLSTDDEPAGGTPYGELQRDVEQMMTRQGVGATSLPLLREQLLDRLQLYGSPSGQRGGGGGWAMHRDGPRGMVIEGIVPQLAEGLRVHMMGGGQFGPPMLVISGSVNGGKSHFQRAFKLPRSVVPEAVEVGFSAKTGGLHIKTPGYFAREDAITPEERECICHLMSSLRDIFNAPHKRSKRSGHSVGNALRGAAHDAGQGGLQPENSETQEQIKTLAPKVLAAMKHAGQGHLGKSNRAYWRLASSEADGGDGAGTKLAFPNTEKAEPELMPKIEVVVDAQHSGGVSSEVTRSKRGKSVVVVTDSTTQQQLARVSLPLPVQGGAKVAQDRAKKGRYVVRYDIADDAARTVERLPIVLRDEL